MARRDRRIKLLIAYNGTRYHGWQLQPRAVTVQGTLESCLSRITNDPVRLHAAGRTDAGVHALGQVAHFDTASRIAASSLVRGLNGLLPDDLVVRRAVEVPADFHARYDAARKTYVYQIHNHAIPSLLHAQYAWHVPQPLDVPAMKAAARLLLGRHDFSAFRGASRDDTRQPVRCLYRLAFRQWPPRLICILSADGFLYRMARNIVGALVAVGRDAAPAEAVGGMLQTGRRELAGATAPANGLLLAHVSYRGGKAG
jgi:tRNA pseudouridine38-40 synthase